MRRIFKATPWLEHPDLSACIWSSCQTTPRKSRNQRFPPEGIGHFAGFPCQTPSKSFGAAFSGRWTCHAPKTESAAVPAWIFVKQNCVNLRFTANMGFPNKTRNSGSEFLFGRGGNPHPLGFAIEWPGAEGQRAGGCCRTAGLGRLAARSP